MSHLRVVSSSTDEAAGRCGTLTSVRVEAPGKVNLFLSVGQAEADGYHSLTTVFQAVRLIETVTARCQAAHARGQITLSLEEPDPSVPTDGRNLAVRAAELLAAEMGVKDGVDLLLRKRVPVAGGMAGGSADAAAALLACNQLWNTGCTPAQLRELAAQLGADCAFPLVGATAVGSHRGEQLSPLMTRGSYHWVFALAHDGLSTPVVFEEYDRMCAQADCEGRSYSPHPEAVPEEMISALRKGDTQALAQAMHNDLQAPALRLRPELGDVIAIAEEAGALRAIVSGSGPTVAALVKDATAAMRVERALVASGLVARCVRADAPVAGARVVG